jgi:hypothetical protein
MPSCCHSDRDSRELTVSCGNIGCDSSDGIGECRPNRVETASAPGDSTLRRPAVTAQRLDRSEISSAEDRVTVRGPEELPTLTSRATRALLAILVELTEVPVIDTPEEGTRRDS